MNKFILTVFSLIAITIPANALIQDDFAQRTVTSFSIPETNLEYNYNDTKAARCRQNSFRKKSL